MNVLLLIVGIIFVVSILVGYKRGFLKIALSLAITIVSILLVGMMVPYISSWIQKATPIGEVVQEKLAEMFVKQEDAPYDSEISREQQISLIEGAKLPSMIQDRLLENNNSEVYEALGVTTFKDYTGAYITKLLADIIAFIAAWILVTIIARVLMRVAGIVNKIPVIGGVNRIAGGVIGIGIGLIIVWILLIAGTLLYSTPLGQACMEDIAASRILTKLYDGNILMKYIAKF